MATRSLGTLTLDLLLKMGAFTAGMDQAARLTDKRMRDIERRAKQFGRVLGTTIAAGATAAFAGLVAVTKSAIDNADAIRDLSIRVGTSTEVLSAYGYAASQTGTDIETVGKGIKILSKNMADALNPANANAKVFKELGISVTDANGQLKGAADIIPELADKISAMRDGTTKAALMLQLFGKAGLDLTEFFNQGSVGLDAFTEKAKALGIVIDTRTADAADKFKDTLGDVHAAVGGLGLGIARELLPALQDSSQELLELVKNGGLASDIASVLGAAFSAATGIMRGYANAVDVTSAAIEALVRTGAGLAEVTKNIQTFGLASGSIAHGMEEMNAARREGDAALRSIHDQQKALPKPTIITADSGSVAESAFRMSAAEVQARKHADDLEKRLAKALSNPTAKTGGGKSGGKSDAERDAEQVARAIDQMTRAQQNWEAEVAQTGNPIADEYTERLRQINEEAQAFAQDKVPTDQIQAFTDRMKELAATLRDADIAKFQKEFDDQTAEMVAQMQGPAAEALQRFSEDVADLDDLFKRGQISIDEYNARLAVLGQVRDSPMAQVNADLEEQIRLLGMSNEQQEIYNNLKQAGVRADDPWGQVIVANTERLQEQRQAVADQIEVMDGLRDASHTFLDDLQEGKGVWDSLKDAASQFLDVLIQIGERKLIEQIFGQQGTTGSGSAGNGWLASILSMFTSSGSFGGSGSPLAGGGMVDPSKTHQVGEFDRPEVFMSRGKNWLLPGNSGRVVPLREFGGGGHSPMVFNFNVQGKVNRETGTQAGKRVATETRIATARNG